MIKKSFKLMICALLSLTFIISPVMVSASDPNKIKQAEDDINKAKSDIENFDKDIQSATDLIMKTDDAISNLTLTINDNKSKIEELNSEITKKQALVFEAHEETVNAVDLFKNRAEEIYKFGNNNYVEGLITSHGVEDFIQKLSYINKAISIDKQLVQNCETTEKNYNDKVNELKDVLREQENLKSANEIKVDEMNTYKSQQEKNIQELEGKKKASSNLITESELVIDLSRYNIDYSPNRGGEDPDPVSLALSFVNKTPYVWGGTTPDGFDCSGLVVYCYRNASGLILPRTSEVQQTVGTEISEQDLQRGDLVFYGNPAHHVGIYIGEGMMVDAPYTGRNVSVEPIHVYSDYSGAKRVK